MRLGWVLSATPPTLHVIFFSRARTMEHVGIQTPPSMDTCVNVCFTSMALNANWIIDLVYRIPVGIKVRSSLFRLADR